MGHPKLDGHRPLPYIPRMPADRSTNIFARLWLLLAVLGATIAPATAVQCPDRPIKLAFFEAQVLYTNGQGLDKDFVDELQRRSKCRFETEAMPRARVWKELEEGRLDMTTSVLPTPARAESLWIINYFQLRNYLILLKSQAGHIKSLDEFLAGPKTLVFGRVRGYKHGTTLDQWMSQLAAQGRVHDVVKSDLLYHMLKRERISALAGPPMIYKSKLQEHGLTDKVVIADWGGPSAASPRGLGLSKRTFSEAQAREWRTLIEAIQNDGTMRRLLRKHLDAPEAEGMLLPR